MVLRVELQRVECVNPEDGADELLMLSRVRAEDADGLKVLAGDRAVLITDFEEGEVLNRNFDPATAEFEVVEEFESGNLFHSMVLADMRGEGPVDLDPVRRIRMSSLGLEIDGVGRTQRLANVAAARWHENDREVYVGGGDRHDVLWNLNWDINRGELRRALSGGELPATVVLSDVSAQSSRSYRLGGNSDAPRLLEDFVIDVPDGDYHYEFTIRYTWPGI